MLREAADLPELSDLAHELDKLEQECLGIKVIVAGGSAGEEGGESFRLHSARR